MLIAFGTGYARAQLPFSNFSLGDDHGLTNMNGRELLPPIYAGIRYLGHGLFLLQQRCSEPGKRFDCAKEKILLNHSLIKLNTPVPSDATFERLLSLGKRADKNNELNVDAIPADALLVFCADNYFGVCDSKGREILPPDCVWIGNLSEGTVALCKADGFLYTFNFEFRKLQKLSYQNVRQDCRLDFSEGLAAFASKATPQSRSMWGFIDTSGNVVIEPKFDFAWNFVDGLACVRFPDSGSQGSPAHNELIDKAGKLASPPNLKVIMTFGPYIEVQDSSGNYGVVDSHFKCVIPPKYTSISAQLERSSTVDEMGIWYPSKTIPIYYFAKQKVDGKSVILSSKGALVLEIPSELILPGRTSQPIFMDGVFVCKRGPGMPLAKATFINFKGKTVPAPYCNFSDSKDVRFGKIAPGILLKTIPGSKEQMNDYRARMFAPKDRSLREYFCDVLKPVVDDFEAGHYQDALSNLQKAKLDDRRDPIYQPVYIRALCLQALGKFAEATTDYATVNEFSSDQFLKDRSHMGLECCFKKQSSIPPKMLTFPPRWEQDGGLGVPLPRRR